MIQPACIYGIAMRDEGVIKFNCQWEKVPAFPENKIPDLIKWRNRLFDLGFIGVYPDGIGFGNVSQRLNPKGQFIITGTQTGHLPCLDQGHFTKVSAWDIERNSVTCQGPVKASSESLTHAMIYQLSDDIRAIIHIHHPAFWKSLLGIVPTSAQSVPYGTPAMAQEVRRLYEQSDLSKLKIFAMAGHEDGIVTFGQDLEEAGNILFQYARKNGLQV